MSNGEYALIHNWAVLNSVQLQYLNMFVDFVSSVLPTYIHMYV